MLRLVALGSLAIVLIGTGVRATTVEELCGSPVPDPCRITTSRTVEPGSVLDFRPAALVVATINGRLDAGPGSMAIIARDVTLDAGSRLLAAGGQITVVVTGRIIVNAAARIDVSATGGGGSMLLGAGGDILVDGPLRAGGIGIPTFGGSVVIAATGAIRLHDVDASGGAQAAPPGGAQASVEVTAGGDVELSGTVDVSHGECLTCGIGISAGGDVSAGKLIAQGKGPAGSGGAITLTGASIVLAGDLVATGGGGDPDFGGGGGDVMVVADDALDVNASILLGGTAPDGDGGTFDLSAGGDLRIAAAAVLDAEGGGEGCGGFPAYLTAGRDLTTGRIKLGGGSCGGGSLDAVAGRDLTVGARITAGATSDGSAGDVALEAARTVRIDADVDAGGSVAGSGGSVVAEGCDVTVAAGVASQASGPDGSNTLLAHGLLTVAGRVEAGGANVLAFGNPARPPIVTGVVLPPAVPVLDPALVACTAVATCGDGTRDPAEECDDGNADSCDGCSAGCQAEVCGNGRLDCAEACDPPDLARCDAACQVLPQSTVLLPGSPRRNACQAEWQLELAAPALSSSGLPETTQGCTDGDPGCDADGGNDGRCTFRARVCLRVPDPRHPDCAPAAIDYVKLKAPLPLDPGDATDAANSSALLDALSALGVTVKQGSIVLHVGVPDPLADHCTAPLALLVPHDGRKRRRRFSLGAEDVAAHVMSNNAIRLDCFPNSAVCGDGVVAAGEHCDDGNTQACDGCSPTCRMEACGNGVIDCDEQCDAGIPIPPPASGCTARCTEVPPALRIPGGGSRPLDCAHEWGIALADSTIARDPRGVPRNRQDCVDGDARCDFDPAPGSCRFHVFQCLGGADARLGCAAASVGAVEVVRPKASDQSPARDRLVHALAELPLPVGPGEVCTRRVDVDVPAGRKPMAIQVQAQLVGGKPDRDTLKLRCLPPPGA